MDIFQRDSVGVSIVNGSVLTNDGSWSDWGLLVRLDCVAALAAYFPVAMLTEKNPSTASVGGMGFPS